MSEKLSSAASRLFGCAIAGCLSVCLFETRLATDDDDGRARAERSRIHKKEGNRQNPDQFTHIRSDNESQPAADDLVAYSLTHSPKKSAPLAKWSQLVHQSGSNGPTF